VISASSVLTPSVEGTNWPFGSPFAVGAPVVVGGGGLEGPAMALEGTVAAGPDCWAVFAGDDPARVDDGLDIVRMKLALRMKLAGWRRGEWWDY